MKTTNKKLIPPLVKKGKVGVLATDTLYGLVGLALNEETVERIYKLKKRSNSKPFIVLIADKIDLLKFGIILNSQMEEVIERLWPGPVTIVLPCPLVNYKYLHRGKKTIAFRLPANEEFRKFLSVTGPLVAPTANPAGKEPAKTIEEAEKYFGGQLDFYLDSGKVEGEASTIISLKNGKMKILRQGVVKIDESAKK